MALGGAGSCNGRLACLALTIAALDLLSDGIRPLRLENPFLNKMDDMVSVLLVFAASCVVLFLVVAVATRRF